MNSCGARKRTKIVQEKVETENRDVSITSQKSENINTKVISEVDKVTYEPVDSTMPMVINNDTIVNATVTFENKKSDSTSTFAKNERVDLNDDSQFANQESSINVETEREGFDRNGLKTALIYLIVLVVVVLVGRAKKWF